MLFELDEILTNEILFYMENQEGDFAYDADEKKIIGIKNKEAASEDRGRFVPLPEWKARDGYRLMEKFCAELKNPAARADLSRSLNEKKGVFRSFKNALEQYPHVEKLWLAFKHKKMKEAVCLWYNALRAEYGLEPVGAEPEDNSSLVLEDFILRDGKLSDREKASALHKLCAAERSGKALSRLYEETNPFIFPGDISVVAESPSGDFCGYISAVKSSKLYLRVRQLEIQTEYRGLGLGKTMLSKFVEKAQSLKLHVTADVPAESEFFSRVLYLENFKPYAQSFVLFGAAENGVEVLP